MIGRQTCALLTAVLAASVCAGQVYQATWESVGKHRAPAWFEDAKLGIFIHWGLYSVPAWAPPTGELGKVAPGQWFRLNPYAEWYMNTMQIQDSPTWKHHVATYGEKFSYLDFIPAFNAEIQKWKPEAWAKVLKETGARYVVLTTKHHDGFTLWPSRIRNPNRPADRQGAARDLVGELTRAVRAQGLKMGLYYSGGLDWSFQNGPIRNGEELYKLVPQSEEYARYADAHWRELIERYQPALMWNDISYPKKGDLPALFAEYLNRVEDGAINDRFGVPFSDFTTPEYAKYDQITPKKWESCRGLGFSFGYNQVEGPEHVLPAGELIRLLVDIVSKNGNLLLNIGPKPDGSISELQLQRLHELGQWLKVNGEGIFGSRPWVKASGKTADGIEVRFTRKGDSLYVFLFGKPQNASVVIPSVSTGDGTKIRLLGTEGDLQWSQKGGDLAITLPSRYADQHVYGLKITSALSAAR
jgi:alpha-L-fucosidase